MTVLGAGLLWFGWFGFNAGSALAADGLAANAFVVTNTAAAAGALTWVVVELRPHQRKVERPRRGRRRGRRAGRDHAGRPVSSPPAAAIVIGLGAGVLCYGATLLARARSGSTTRSTSSRVHGVGGIWGALATGVFATTAIQTASRACSTAIPARS